MACNAKAKMKPRNVTSKMKAKVQRPKATAKKKAAASSRGPKVCGECGTVVPYAKMAYHMRKEHCQTATRGASASAAPVLPMWNNLLRHSLPKEGME